MLSYACFTLQSPILIFVEVQPKIAAICQDADNWQQLDSPFASISQNLQLWQMFKKHLNWKLQMVSMFIHSQRLLFSNRS